MAQANTANNNAGAHAAADQVRDIEADGFRVLMQKHGLTGKSIVKDTFTGSIVAKDTKTGTETVLVDSTKGAYQGSDFRYLGEQSTTGLLLFQDATSSKVFKVDVRKGSITEITNKRVPVTVKTADGTYATYVVEKGKDGSTTVKDNKGKPVHDLKQRETKPETEGGDLSSILDGIELPDFSEEAEMAKFWEQRAEHVGQEAMEKQRAEWLAEKAAQAKDGEKGDLSSILDGIDFPRMTDASNEEEFDKQREAYNKQAEAEKAAQAKDGEKGDLSSILDGIDFPRMTDASNEEEFDKQREAYNKQAEAEKAAQAKDGEKGDLSSILDGIDFPRMTDASNEEEFDKQREAYNQGK
ncbi:hypothetical protein [Streptomyces olivoreticuli]|uniref:hypothetical protein n=1 Tax=Streptomyces olivoreticuli TaxID=68246 RepID=UPI0013C30104|nr:hypothetical protein [Streptomyces olivoreticuli]